MIDKSKLDLNARIYNNKHWTYNDFLDYIDHTDLTFYYKGRGYNITCAGKPCIAACMESPKEWFETVKYFDSYEELLLNYEFEDGVPILKAFEEYKDIKPE